jgi:4-carboxymuconolactone decarboxylase
MKDRSFDTVGSAEVITHLAFYVGCPNAFSALPVTKDAFEKRQS